MATIGLVQVENPLEFGIVITHEDGSIERFLEKPTWGQVFSDTINTGIFVLEPEIFDYIAAGPPGRLLLRGVPRACSTTASRCTARSPRATGRTSARSRPTCGPTRTSSTARSRSTIPGFEIGRRRVGRRGRRDPPRRRASTGPAVIGDNCRVEAGARLGEYTVLGTNVRVRGRRRPRAHASCTTTPTSARACACAAPSSAGPATCAAACAARRASVLGDECFVGEDAVLGAGVKVYPFKTVEAGAVVNTSIVWESRGARSLFGRGGVSGLANVDITPELAARVAMAFGTHAQEGRHGHHLPRLQPLGPHAQAGDDGRPQRRPASTCWTSRWRRCRSPGSTCRSAQVAGAASPSASARTTPQSVRHPLLRRRRRRHHRGRPAQDRAALRPRGLPPGAPRRDRRHRLPAPGARAVRRRPSRPTVDVEADRAAGASRSSIDYSLRLHLVRDAQRAVQARRRRAGGQPVRLHRRASLGFDRDEHAASVAGLVRASGAHLGAVHRPRRRAPHA